MDDYNYWWLVAAINQNYKCNIIGADYTILDDVRLYPRAIVAICRAFTYFRHRYVFTPTSHAAL